MWKKLFFVLSFFFCLHSFAHAQSLKIGVISDIHYMAPSLLVEKGTAFDNYAKSDRKLLLESPAILKATVQNLLIAKVNVVFITGDLTKDGELASHEGVVEMLKPLLDKGVKVLVVPGNHDINNPYSVSFYGNYTKAAPTVSADEFRRIYGKYGFETAISTDKNSLSYVSEPVEGLRVLCIDDCEYYNNTFKSKGADLDSRVTNGMIKPETMEWAKNEIAQARQQGKHIIGMIHHNIVEHFDYEGLFATPYMVDNYRNVQKEFMLAGLNVIFTGHFHATDIARVDDEKGNYLYDVETGSTVTYPCPYRLIEFAGDSLRIETKHIEHIDFELPDGVDFQTYARNRLKNEIPVIISGLIAGNYQRLSKAIPKFAASFIKIPDEQVLTQMALKYFTTSGTDLLLAHYCGNENLVDSADIKCEELFKNIDAIIHEFSVKSSGVLSPMVEEALKNSEITNKLKDTFTSIWKDKIGPDYYNKDYKWQMKYPVNDLNLVIRLTPVAQRQRSTVNNPQ